MSANIQLSFSTIAAGKQLLTIGTGMYYEQWVLEKKGGWGAGVATYLGRIGPGRNDIMSAHIDP